MDRIRRYLGGVSHLLESAPEEDIRLAAELILSAYQDGRSVYIMGNGGSAATASHFACDLQKSVGLCGGRKFRVMALTDNVAILTAWANDVDYAEIFAEQLSTWLQTGDLVIGISGSGNSPNIIKAIELANSKGAVTIGMTGFGGGKLAEQARYSIVVDSDNLQQVEDVHMAFCHLIFRYVLDEVRPEAA